MKITKRRCVYKGKYLKVIEKEFIGDNNKRFVWECAERHDAVFVFPVTKDKQVILEKNYRIPAEDFIIEIPAGLLDKKGEKPEVAAKRELLEETGYLATKIIPIYDYYLTPASGSHRVYLFYAPNVVPTDKINPEDAEYIEIIKVPIKNLEKFLIGQKKKRVKIDVNLWGAIALLKIKKLV